jgi:hypothetical protein
MPSFVGRNLFFMGTETVGMQINAADGNLGTQGNDNASGFIYCPGATSMVTNMPVDPGAFGSGEGVALYDANGVFISSYTSSHFTVEGPGVIVNGDAFTLPGTQTYVRFAYVPSWFSNGYGGAPGYPEPETQAMIFATTTGTATLPGSFVASGFATPAYVDASSAAALSTALAAVAAAAAGTSYSATLTFNAAGSQTVTHSLGTWAPTVTYTTLIGGNIYSAYPASANGTIITAASAGTVLVTFQKAPALPIQVPSPAIVALNATSGLVDHWPMTDGQGSQFANPVTPANYIATTDSYALWGLSQSPFQSLLSAWLPGSGYTAQAAEVNTPSNLGGAAAFTLSAWVYPTYSDSSYRVVASNGRINLTYQASTFLLNILGATSGDSIYIYVPSAPFPINSLYHVLVTYSGSGHASGMALYVNGVAQTTTIAADTYVNPATSSWPWAIGAGATGSLGATGIFAGPIAGVRVYSRVLTSLEIAAIFAAGAE